MAGVDFGRPAVQRLISAGAVVLLHVLVLWLVITQTGIVTEILPPIMAVQILRPEEKPPPPPPIVPKLPPVLMQVPIPEIPVPPPPTAQSSAPRAIVRVSPQGPPASHFGAAAGEEGLGVGVATTAGGGTNARGSLGNFDALVKRMILARKRQPSLAWDRRNTCVINYSVTIGAGGSLAGFRIDPCAVPEINAAAEAAIRSAAPFPAPPDLGGAATTVHGTLIFQP